jgi:propionyl-CoA carboxylase alpha chain
VLRDPMFLDRGADTSLLDSYDLARLVPGERACRISAAAAAVAVAAANRRDAKVAASLPGGWRNVVSEPQLTSFAGPRGRIDIRYAWTRRGIAFPGADSPEAGADPDADRTATPEADPELMAVAFTPDQVTLDMGGVRYRFGIVRAGADLWVSSGIGSVHLALLDRLPPPVRIRETGSLVAPMPGSVTRVAAAPGDRVVAGQLVLVLEAMKMEHQIAAPSDGVLAEVRVGPGAQVNAGDVLAIVTAPAASDTGDES